MESDSNTIGQPFTARASAGLTAVPLFHAAWLFAAGIAVTRALWLRPSLVLVALALVAVLCGLAALRAQRVAGLPLALPVVFAGGVVRRDGAPSGSRTHSQCAV